MRRSCAARSRMAASAYWTKDPHWRSQACMRLSVQVFRAAEQLDLAENACKRGGLGRVYESWSSKACFSIALASRYNASHPEASRASSILPADSKGT